MEGGYLNLVKSHTFSTHFHTLPIPFPLETSGFLTEHHIIEEKNLISHFCFSLKLSPSTLIWVCVCLEGGNSKLKQSFFFLILPQ